MKTIKVLLVDDDDSIRGMYATVFKKEGFEVIEAVDGVDGLDKATKNAPDVIFTGIVMPTMDGFQLMEALAKNVATSKIPVVISSHLGREEDHRRANELGAKEFFVRGMYTPNEIAEKIRSMFDAHEYRLKFIPDELDAKKLFTDMHMDPEFKCGDCRGDLILSLQVANVERHEFTAKFICSKCDKIQN
jgi:CheY-like chemotaxis protein